MDALQTQLTSIADLQKVLLLRTLKRFCKAIEGIYGATYLRNPNREDLKRLLRKADKRGFPGMIGSLDCMHWEWKNCPTSWAGQFKGRHNKPTIVLEAVASYDTWIWHAFFGAPGSNNDINVLWSSPLFDNVVNGWAPEFRYKVNGNRYELGYYLTDGIYPSWSTFVKSFSHPDSAKKKLFSQRQESYRKDVERAFGILQARWAIVRGPARFWQSEDLHSIMMTCIILHNMIVEDEYIEIEEDSDEDVDDDQPTHARAIARDVEYLAPTTYETRQDRVTLSEYMRRLNRIQAPQCHDTLRKDLVEHVWRREGERWWCWLSIYVIILSVLCNKFCNILQRRNYFVYTRRIGLFGILVINLSVFLCKVFCLVRWINYWMEFELLKGIYYTSKCGTNKYNNYWRHLD